MHTHTHTHSHTLFSKTETPLIGQRVQSCRAVDMRANAERPASGVGLGNTFVGVPGMGTVDDGRRPCLGAAIMLPCSREVPMRNTSPAASPPVAFRGGALFSKVDQYT